MADTGLAGLDKLTGGLSVAGVKGFFSDMGMYFVWGILIIGGLFFAWLKYQDKKIYIYPVRIFRQRHHGMVKELNTFGGYVTKGGVTQFMIKTGKFKKKPASKLPSAELMDEDNRVYYMQISPDSPLVQVQRDFFIETVLVPNEKFTEPTEQLKSEIINKFLMDMQQHPDYVSLSSDEQKAKAIELAEQYIEDERNIKIDITKPTYTPVPSDLKQQAIMDINNYKNTLGVDVNKQFAYFIAGVIALVIIGVVIFYIAVNKGDIPILTK